METLKLRQQQRSALTTRPTPVYRNLPAQLTFSQRSCQPLSSSSLKRHPHQSCVSLLTHRQKASPLFRHTLANEKFGVIFTFARHLAQPGELWPLPVRACHESPFMVALGIRKLSPPATRKSFLVVLAMGAGAKIVCAAFLRGTITLVQYAAYFGCSLFACHG